LCIEREFIKSLQVSQGTYSCRAWQTEVRSSWGYV